MQNRFRPSNLELRGPRDGLKIGTQSSRGVRSVFFRGDSESAHDSGPRGGPRSRNRQLAGSKPQSANPQSAQSFAIG
eukprot:5659527-Alexandrium_andersonii.AAC.1